MEIVILIIILLVLATLIGLAIEGRSHSVVKKNRTVKVFEQESPTEREESVVDNVAGKAEPKGPDSETKAILSRLRRYVEEREGSRERDMSTNAIISRLKKYVSDASGSPYVDI